MVCGTSSDLVGRCEFDLTTVYGVRQLDRLPRKERKELAERFVDVGTIQFVDNE